MSLEDGNRFVQAIRNLVEHMCSETRPGDDASPFIAARAPDGRLSYTVIEDPWLMSSDEGKNIIARQAMPRFAQKWQAEYIAWASFAWQTEFSQEQSLAMRDFAEAHDLDLSLADDLDKAKEAAGITNLERTEIVQVSMVGPDVEGYCTGLVRRDGGPPTIEWVFDEENQGVHPSDDGSGALLAGRFPDGMRRALEMVKEGPTGPVNNDWRND